ncbi:hypothetical protein GOP47_0029337 [Adiantum capillus-veneris]|nr:hypothetical protein GOP47_0029337 [Adiantum capillus-veneris]
MATAPMTKKIKPVILQPPTSRVSSSWVVGGKCTKLLLCVGNPDGEETNLKKKKSAPPKDDKGKKRQVKKDRKAKKDPNKPKRAPSAFFVFLEEFRKTFRASNPNNKSVSAVGKAGGDKWKSMSSAEKAPYIAKAEKRKAEYEKAMKAYNAKQGQPEEAGGEEDSDKSKSEVNDEDDEILGEND